ncbi:MAG: hypothetical protein JWP97_4975 [Labilithrix sp.]|nr:hypothetical protein [Labilithrix sp.]
MNRRMFLAGAAGALATAAAGVALGRRERDHGVVRVGVMANLTHAPLLAGLGSGRIAELLAPVRVESRVFRSGPRVTEAILGDAIDVGTTGPAPVIVHHARHSSGGDTGLRVLAGCSSGGASFVVTRSSGIRGPADLHGKRLAVTQIGTTQDLTLRSYLAEHGLRDATAGGDVHVNAITGAVVLAQMSTREIDGAWLPEPWPTRIVRELEAVRLLDERDLWEGRRFASAILVTRGARAHDPEVLRLREALAREVSRALADPARCRDEAYAELVRRVGSPGRRSDFDAAWSFVDFTSDPVHASIQRFAAESASLGFVPPGLGIEGLLG